MALVGPITINGSTGNSNWAYKTVVTEIATDPAARTSTVKVENFLGRTKSTSYFAGTYKQTFEAGGQKHTESVYKNSGDIAAGKFVSMGSHTFTITQTTTPLKITVKGSYSDAPFSPSSGSSSGEVTLSKLHEAPVVSIDNIVEKNSILLNYGVSGSTFVPYLSEKDFYISAALYDNAKATQYTVSNSTNNYHAGASPVNVDFSEYDLMWGYDENNNPVARFMFSVWDDTDTRGYIPWASYTVIPYVKPNLVATSSSVKRNGQISGKVNLNLTGTFYNAKIGSKNNTISLSYKYWKKGSSEPSTYYTIPTNAYSISGNTITMSNWSVTKNGSTVTDVVKDSIYVFKIKAVDAMGSVSEITLNCPKGEWLRAIFKDRIDFKRITIGGVDAATKNDIQKHAISARLSYEWSNAFTAWVGYHVPLDETVIAGNKLTFSDGYVIIGKGVSKVRASGAIFYSGDVSSTQKRMWVHLRAGDGSGDKLAIPAYQYFSQSGVNGIVNVPEVIFNVEEGDKIDISAQLGKTGTDRLLTRSTCLYVEVIE